MIQAPPRIDKERSRPAGATSSSGKKLLASCASYVCLAFLSLVLLDCLARFSYQWWPIDRYDSPNRSWIWWVARDFRNQYPSPNPSPSPNLNPDPNQIQNQKQIQHQGRKQAPDIVLLGSSLMMMAVEGGDATYLKTPQILEQHHRSTYLETLLNRSKIPPLSPHPYPDKNLSTFSFAIGGQMASDAYVISRELLKGAHAPYAIVYGIAPRDFMDNCLTDPASTETFRYMERVGNLSDISVTARSSIWEKLDLILGRVCFLYKHKPDLLYLQQEAAKALLKSVGGFQDLNSVHTSYYLRQIALMDLPEDTSETEVVIKPFNAAIDRYQDNLHEYSSRYRQFNQRLFNQQLGYLEKLLELCRQRHIKLILVNMPLTVDNLKLMPPGFYSHYLSAVSALGIKYGGTVFDFNDPPIFPKGDFADSVHLNGQGSMHFFAALSDRLSDKTGLLPQ